MQCVDCKKPLYLENVSLVIYVPGKGIKSCLRPSGDIKLISWEYKANRYVDVVLNR